MTCAPTGLLLKWRRPRLTSFLLQAVCLASIPTHSITAQTAYTIPVGAYVAKVPGKTGDAPPNRTWLGIQLLPPIRFAGEAASVQGNRLNFTGPLPNPDPERQNYLHVLTGEGRGFMADINEFLPSAVICGTDLTPWVTPLARIHIRSHPHLADLFGTANKFNLGTGTSAGTCDNIIIHDNSTQHGKVFYYNSTRNRWEEEEVEADASRTPVRFPNGLLIVRRTPGTLRLSFSGFVSDAPVLLPVRPGDNVFSLPINLTASLSSRITTEGPFSILKGRNSSAADVLAFEEPATSLSRGPFYYQERNAAGGWRKIGINNSTEPTEPLDMMCALILRRSGPAGYIRAEGSLIPPAVSPPPLPPDTELGETPLTAEYPFTLPPNPDITIQFQTSSDLVIWSPYPYAGNPGEKLAFTLPSGSSRAFYRVAVTSSF